MPLLAIPALIAFLINFTVSINLIFSRPRSSQKLWLGLFIFSFSLWNLSQIFLISLFTYPLFLTVGKILYRILFLSPSFFVMVSYYYPIKDEKAEQALSFIFKVFIFPLVILILSFPYVNIEIFELNKFPGNYFFKIKIQSYFYIFILFSLFLAYTLWGAKIMLNKIKNLKLIKLRSQAQIFLIGNLGIFSLLIILNILKYTFFFQNLLWYLAITFLTLLISLFFLIISFEYKWVRLRKLISGSFSYTFITAIIITINYLFLQYVITSASKTISFESVLLNYLFLFFIILMLTPLINFLWKKIDVLFFSWEHIIEEQIQKFIIQIADIWNLSDFFTEVEHFLCTLMKVDYVIILLNNSKDGYEPINEEYDILINYDSYLEKQLYKKQKIIEVYELDHTYLEKTTLLFFDIINAWLIMPLFAKNELLAIIIIPKVENQKINYGLVERLNYFAGELGIILHRNMLIERLKEKEREKERLERLAFLGKLTAGIAHEIRNPLNTISVSAQTLLNRLKQNNQAKELLNFIIEETERLNNVLSDFLSIAKITKLNIQEFDIDNIFAKLEQTVKARNNKIFFSALVHFKPHIIYSDEKLLYQAILNIVINAIEAIEEKCDIDNNFYCEDGKIFIDIYKRFGKYYISIRNNGVLLDKNLAEKIFDPFFTTKDAGSGLGLAITYNIIKSLGGDIYVKTVNDFTIFEIILRQKI